MKYGYTIKTDAKNDPTTGAIPHGADAIATKRTAPETVEATFKRGGNQVETTRFAVSKEGKLQTNTAKGTKPSGQSFDNAIVWDKQ